MFIFVNDMLSSYSSGIAVQHQDGDDAGGQQHQRQGQARLAPLHEQDVQDRLDHHDGDEQRDERLADVPQCGQRIFEVEHLVQVGLPQVGEG